MWRRRATTPDAGHDPALMQAARDRMVRQQVERRGITAPRLLAAMRAVPRHHFVPATRSAEAHADHPLPLLDQQTISQPYIVALTCSHLEDVPPGAKVLDVGAGSGYQAAVLAAMGFTVHAVERRASLVALAASNLAAAAAEGTWSGEAGTIHVHHADGGDGWPDGAPFAAVVAAATAESVPTAWFAQSDVGGRVVAPVGAHTGSQWLTRFDHDPRRGPPDQTSAWESTRLCSVRFVPLVTDP